MSFVLELSPAARRDLKRLPPKVQEEILFAHLPKIQERPFEAGKPLQGVLKGERSYHFVRPHRHGIPEGSIDETKGQGDGETRGEDKNASCLGG